MGFCILVMSFSITWEYVEKTLRCAIMQTTFNETDKPNTGNKQYMDGKKGEKVGYRTNPLNLKKIQEVVSYCFIG